VGTRNTPRPVTMINPEILETSEEIESIDEGCLSVPEFFERVERPESIKVRYYDLDMHEYVREIGGFLARVMQHEIDHLRGVLFYERISPLKRALAKSKLKRIQRGEVVPDYPMIQADGTQTGEIIEAG
ncbi:MAG: peptide deformylase, partial [Bacteroidota bacterium]